jgi:deoxycytidine triphosphate deaminase
MILPSSTIRTIIETVGAISPVTEERLNDIEGNAYDLTLDEILMIKGKPYDQPALPSCYVEGPPPKPRVFIGINKRRIPIQQAVAWRENEDMNWEATCDPGIPYLFKTCETISLPVGVDAEVIPRSSIFRAGGIVAGTWTPHGYTGHLFIHFSIPQHGHPITFERGARFAALKFHRVDNGVSQAYTGIWSGDKSHTDGEERAF